MSHDFSEDKKKAPLLEFAYLGKIDEFLQQVSDMAMQESWNYVHSPNDRPYPILYNYLNHTFIRLQEEGKIIRVGDFLSFNTGLVTENQQEIFAVFKDYGGRIAFVKFCNESDGSMGYYSPLPSRASYFTDPSDLIYDDRLEARINIDHIIGDPINFARFPAEIRSLPTHQLTNTFNGAITHAKKRVRRNYKTAIPQFYRGQYVPKGQLQLLLPLCLIQPSKADLALAIFKENGFYSGRTCLTLDMAINNARLIAKPDDEWLRP